jgi:hypothetical protein
MESHSRRRCIVKEERRHRFPHVLSEFLSAICLGDDAFTKAFRNKSAILLLKYFENELAALSLHTLIFLDYRPVFKSNTPGAPG